MEQGLSQGRDAVRDALRGLPRSRLAGLQLLAEIDRVPTIESLQAFFDLALRSANRAKVERAIQDGARNGWQ